MRASTLITRFCLVGIILGSDALFAQSTIPVRASFAKGRNYRQTSATGIETGGTMFMAQVEFNLSFQTIFQLGITVQLRHTASGRIHDFDSPTNSTFALFKLFDSAGELEAAFPGGAYTLVVSGRNVANSTTVSIDSLAPEPPPTRITNFEAIQSWISPNQNVPVQWERISSGSATDRLSVSTGEGIMVFQPSGLDVQRTDTTLTSLNYDYPYSASLSYYQLVSTNEGSQGLGPSVQFLRGYQLVFPFRMRGSLPVIIEHPVSQVFTPIYGGVFSAKVQSPSPLYFQWWKDGVAIPGETHYALRLERVLQPQDAGFYTLEARGPGGVTMSDPAELLLSPTWRAGIHAGDGPDRGSSDGPRSVARFDRPNAIAIDSLGVVYVADTSNGTVRRVATDGSVSTLAGTPGRFGIVNGVGSAARFSRLGGIAVDTSGNVYVGELGDLSIRKITPSGAVTAVAGGQRGGYQDGMGVSARFETLQSLAVGTDGRIFVADGANHSIRVVTPDGMVGTYAGNPFLRGLADGPRTAARFSNPTAIAASSNGSLLVVDQDFSAIRAISPAGEVSTYHSFAAEQRTVLGSIRALAADPAGNAFVSAIITGLTRVTPAGSIAVIEDPHRIYTRISGASSYSDLATEAMAFDRAGLLYASDNRNNVILKGPIDPGSPNPKIAITFSPQSHILASGDTVLVEGQASGPSLQYHWRRDGVQIPGATGNKLLVRRGDQSLSGRYTLSARNAIGAVISAPADVAFGTTNNVGRLSNLSVRSPAGSGAQTLIVGLAVGGAAANDGKTLLIRGVGPGLAGFGVEGALVDPVLSVYRGTQVLAANDDWGGGTALDDTFSSVGAFALPAASRDAALGLSFSTGAYTVQIAGNGGATGVALAEIYDGTPGAMAPGATRLTNLSARTQVGTGANTLIAGFVVAGGTSKTVLIRAIGPSLTQFGVTGTLTDPRLQLYRGSELIASNDSWRDGGSVLSTAFTTVGAFSIYDVDAALLITLAPGNYSVQVSGREGGTGIALVEVYELP